MKRTVAWFAVLGVLAVPDWAAACWPHWCCQPVCPPAFYAPPPLYTTPVYPPVYVSPVYPAPPAYGFVSPPAYPTVETVPAKNAVIPKMAVPMVAPAPPSAGKTGAMEPGSPAPSGTGAEGRSGGPNTASQGKSDVVQPAAGVDLHSPKAPAKGPISPSSSGDLPPLVLPKEPERKNSKGGESAGQPLPTAKPSPAPADLIPSPMPMPMGPMGLTLPGFPPYSPSTTPSDSAAKSKQESLPSITLPPEVPVKPDSVSRSSPLTGGASGTVSVKRFPFAVAGFAGGYRTVRFYNHAAKDLDLTIEGRAVKLPAKTYVEAKLGPTFTWSYGGKDAVTERLSAAAAGLDVVFRE